jgi:hypothetical protein
MPTAGVLRLRFFAEVNRQGKRFMSDEHLTLDGTLIQAWASQKSFRSKDGPDDGDGTNFHGQKRSNKTHASSTDPDAQLYKKSYGKESKLRSCAGREPQRADYGRDGHARRWVCRARRRAVDAGQRAEGPLAAYQLLRWNATQISTGVHGERKNVAQQLMHYFLLRTIPGASSPRFALHLYANYSRPAVSRIWSVRKRWPWKTNSSRKSLLIPQRLLLAHRRVQLVVTNVQRR